MINLLRLEVAMLRGVGGGMFDQSEKFQVAMKMMGRSVRWKIGSWKKCEVVDKEWRLGR